MGKVEHVRRELYAVHARFLRKSADAECERGTNIAVQPWWHVPAMRYLQWAFPLDLPHADGLKSIRPQNRTWSGRIVPWDRSHTRYLFYFYYGLKGNAVLFVSYVLTFFAEIIYVENLKSRSRGGVFPESPGASSSQEIESLRATHKMKRRMKLKGYLSEPVAEQCSAPAKKMHKSPENLKTFHRSTRSSVNEDARLAPAHNIPSHPNNLTKILGRPHTSIWHCWHLKGPFSLSSRTLFIVCQTGSGIKDLPPGALVQPQSILSSKSQ